MKNVNGFTFRFKNGAYECRGREITNDYGDKVPEPKLVEAAEKLAEMLTKQGKQAFVVFSEKGWIEVQINN